MEKSEKRISIINQIFENSQGLTKEDLKAISNFSALLSEANLKDKDVQDEVLYLYKFFENEDPLPSFKGQASINLFNEKIFCYLQRRFVILPELIDFLLQEENDKIDVFFVERKREYGIPCLDIAYRNSSDGNYYYIDNMTDKVIMTDFFSAQKVFEENSKLRLDLHENPNNYGCPTKIMIDKSNFADFKKFQIGKVNPKVHLSTGINLDREQPDFYKRVTLVMNFGSEQDGEYYPDMEHYYDTYHLCPPGTC